MNLIDKKKCADLLRDVCADLEKKPHFADIRAQVNHLREYADKLSPPDANPYAETQWQGLQAGLHWKGTPDELEAGLKEMKARNQKTGNRKEKTEKSKQETGIPEIAY